MKICPSCQRTYTDEIAFCPRDGTPLQADATLPAGHVFDGRYEIEELIAETRNGRLYRAHDNTLNRRALLVIFSPELGRGINRKLRHLQLDLRTRFRPGVSNTADIYHFTDNFMAMSYVEWQTLDEELRRHGRFTPGAVAGMLEPVAEALDDARKLGIVCEFLTPADLLVRRVENEFHIIGLLPLITNRRFVERNTGGKSNPIKSGIEVAAVPYVAPELWNDDAPPGAATRALVYSLGVIAYELISGRKPDDALAPRENSPAPAAGQPRPLTELAPDVTPGVARVVERALAQAAENRPATAGEFVSELQDALGIKKPEKPTVEDSLSARISLSVAADTGSDEEYSGTKPISRAAGSSLPAATEEFADKPLYADENVQFTVYQPETIAPARWHTLLAFAHLSKRRPDAPTDEPEPLAEVKRLAARVLADETAEYDALKQNSLHAVPRQGEITFVPDVDGCEFNPPSQTFSWQKSVHKVEFELRAAASLDGRVARGRLTVFLGTLILADVPLAIRVDSAASQSATSDAPAAAVVPASAAPYRKIFPSYSHKDRAVVEQIEHHIHALGDKYLRDVAELRAGQDWQRWMRDAIREADVFQLFWSHNSMRSVYVRQEWEYALSLGRANFVRPTYWEEPLPESPAENLPPQELRQLHFQHLRANTTAYHPPPPAASATDDAGGSQVAPAILDLSEVDGFVFREAAGDSYTAPPEVERIARAADEQPAAATVMCTRCGERNLPEKAFCQTCGSALSATAQSPSTQMGAARSSSPPAQASAPEVSNALDIFWEKRAREEQQRAQREAERARREEEHARREEKHAAQQSLPLQSYSQMPSSSSAPQPRPPYLFILLFVVALLFALAVGVYLLVRLL